MKLFDLHCDTAGVCFDKKIRLNDETLHLNLCKGECLDEWAQLFAIWIKDELRGKNAEIYFEKAFENFNREINENSCKIKLCKGFDDILLALNDKKCAAMLTCEGGSAFACPERIIQAKSYAVKLITLTWDGENELGFGAQSGSENGLKPMGKAVLREMERQKIIADVSHLNRAGFYDAVSSGATVIASHSNCKTVLERVMSNEEERVFACRRSLDDEQIKLLRECGSLIGINFCWYYLGDKGDDGFEAVYRQIEHLLDMGCENVIALGSDFDGCEMNPALAGVDKMTDLYSFLQRKGLDSRLIDKIFFDNVFNFFKKVLQN